MHEVLRMKKVSIIIATFNRKELIKNAVKSALMQTYPNIEIIVVDDGSQYNILSVLKEYEKKITIIQNKKNLGQGASRNIGIRESSGDYISFLDDDDIFHPRKIERQIKIINKKRNIGLVYCPIAIKIDKELIYKPAREEKNYWVRLTYQNTIGITPLIKKECFSACGDFDNSLLYHIDRDLWYRIGKKYKFSFINWPYYLIYGLNMDRSTLKIENCSLGKKMLYQKYKNDFDDKNIYFSDLHYELAINFLKFNFYKDFIWHFKKSIELNPNKLKLFLRSFIGIPINKCRLSKINIDDGYKLILN